MAEVFESWLIGASPFFRGIWFHVRVSFYGDSLLWGFPFGEVGELIVGLPFLGNLGKPCFPFMGIAILGYG